MKENKKYSKSEWEDLARIFSGEESANTVNVNEFNAGDGGATESTWKNLGSVKMHEKTDVDSAWNKLSARIDSVGDYQPKTLRLVSWSKVLQAAAAVIILAAISTVIYFTANPGFLSGKVLVATNQDQINKEVGLPDGSKVFLNRNTEISYNKKFKEGREVKLKGEAYFDIQHDPANPFTVDAGSASVKVLGTSFNVISMNTNSSVEVFVTSGKVLLTEKSGKSELQLDPGYIGTAGSGNARKTFNTDPNYMAWNTGSLFYENQALKVVFSDLKRVYNINIVADDPSILEEVWTSPINKMPEETIIQLICFSFNLGYKKEGEVYHLSKK